MANINLKLLRIKNDLTQAEIAEKIGVTRASYSMIESGQRAGGFDFWEAVQAAFGIPDADMWGIMHNRKESTK